MNGAATQVQTTFRGKQGRAKADAKKQAVRSRAEKHVQIGIQPKLGLSRPPEAGVLVAGTPCPTFSILYKRDRVW